MISCDPTLRMRLIAVAQDLAAPDMLIRRAEVWNAFTGEIGAADIAVCADRIAKVGPWSGPVSEATQQIDASGRIAVPGYIEPHTHPWPFVNPLSLAEAAACRGTTCLVYDQSLLYLVLGSERLEQAVDALSAAALTQIFWVARVAGQSRFLGEEQFFSRDAIGRLLDNRNFLGTAEMTRWSDLLDPDRSERILDLFEDARRRGKYNDGHMAGASQRRLDALATAGIRCCHEAIDADEAIDRLRRGIWVIFRNSSLREDLSALLPSLERSEFHDRFAYTTDAVAEPFVEEHGYIDYMIGVALRAGVAPGTAYRMATLNAATLLRLDDDLGAVAPGRIANVNLLSGLEQPAPEAVVCRGRLVARDGALVVSAPSEHFNWEECYAGSAPSIPQWGAGVFALPVRAPNPFPAGRLINAVITRTSPVCLRADRLGLWPVEPDSLVLAATDRGGHWITRGVVQNMAPGLLALATTYTTSGGILVLGQSAQAMAEALARLRRLGGGITICSISGRWWELAFPVAGIHRAGGFSGAVQAARAFQAALKDCGYPHADPKYTLLFLTGDVLPELRATEAGWISLRTGEILFPSERLNDDVQTRTTLPAEG